jgi:FtsH-binding integral membrane protein
MSSVVVPLYFIHITIAFIILAWWFTRKKAQALKYFGWGLTGYALGIGTWTLVVLTKPTSLEPPILIGVVPFLLAHVAFAKATMLRTKSKLVLPLTVLLLAATFIARTFYFQSKPYFSDQGYFFFGLMAVPLAFYIATIAVSFLSASITAMGDIKSTTVRRIMTSGLIGVFINMVIQISVQDESLRIINAVVATVTLFGLWVTAVTHQSEKI